MNIQNLIPHFNQVTRYSRIATLILLLGIIPSLSFYIGREYAHTEYVITKSPETPVPSLVDMHQTQLVSSDATTASLASGIIKDQITYTIRTFVGTYGTSTYPVILADSRGGLFENINKEVQEFATTDCEHDIDSRTVYEPYEFLTDAEITHAKNDILSIKTQYQIYCGGPYPDANLYYTTYDLRTGDEVVFTELFKNYEKDRVALTTLFDRIYAETGNAEEECSELAGGQYEYSSFSVTETGIALETSFPHVARACSKTLMVSYDELKPYLASGNILSRLHE